MPARGSALACIGVWLAALGCGSGGGSTGGLDAATGPGGGSAGDRGEPVSGSSGSPRAGEGAPPALQADAAVAPDASERDAALDAGTPATDAGPDDAAAATAPCVEGAAIEALTPDAGFARFGSVFSSTLYEIGQPATHDPQPVRIRVSAAGVPVANCEVAWRPADSSGWVFPDAPTTDADGEISAWWTAGDAREQSLEVSLVHEDGTVASATITGRAEPSPGTRTDSIHIHYVLDDVPYSEFSVDVTPINGPDTTYYSTINFPGGYTGIQFVEAGGDPATMVIFSVWDSDGGDAEVIDPAESSTCVGFGGEGTGASCRYFHPLSASATYRTHLMIEYPAGCADCTDYSVYFTDVTAGGAAVKIATLRYAQRVQADYATGFVEDWAERSGDSCTSEERAAYFHDVRARVDGTWIDIDRARFGAVYQPANNEICANYFYGAQDGKFLWSSGGTDRVAAPYFGGEGPLVSLR